VLVQIVIGKNTDLIGNVQVVVDIGSGLPSPGATDNIPIVLAFDDGILNRDAFVFPFSF
jgi:hypothetical protein